MKMTGRMKKPIMTIVILLVLLVIFLLAILVGQTGFDGRPTGPAPVFSATDHLGRSFSLEDMVGNVTVIMFIQIENPLCIECEEYMHEEIVAFKELFNKHISNVSLITINMRKNPYSDDGWVLVNQTYGIDIDWHWVEEFEPYPVAAKYMTYWDLGGSLSNPTILLLDTSNQIVAVYNVYCMGKGPVDGIRDSSSLEEDIVRISSGEWDVPEDANVGLISSATMAGMFLLGAITAFSPCSIAMLIAAISFITSRGLGTVRNDEDGAFLTDGMRIGIFFTIGTAMVFMTFGLFLSYIAGIIEISPIFYFFAGVLLILFGLNAVLPLAHQIKTGLIWVFQRISRSDRFLIGTGKKSPSLLEKLGGKSSELSGLMLGIMFSIGWAPCALTLVFPVLILVITQDISSVEGAAMMLFFGLGHGIVIIPFCATSDALRRKTGKTYLAIARWIQPIFAIVLILLGAIFMMRVAGINLW
jgi:cytochrome c-type biogenesis protein